jgi:hypothetical protein
MTGAELTQLVHEIIATPADLRDRVKAAIQPKDARALPNPKKKSN